MGIEYWCVLYEYARVCVCVCVCEREREREKQRQTQRDGERPLFLRRKATSAYKIFESQVL